MDGRERFATAYRCWLQDWLDPSGEYTKLFSILYATEFRWSVAGDENRAGDGRRLRVRFAETRGLDIPEDYDEWPCSVLEMLSALAWRADEVLMYDPEYGDRSQVWFWVMMDNLELSKATDEMFESMPDETAEFVRKKVANWMDREYPRDGSGSIFPDSRGVLDQRKRQIWDQMNDYFFRF